MKIIVNMAGSLGNQMFSYAFGYALAKETGATYYIDTYVQDNKLTRPFELEHFQLVYDKRVSFLYRGDILNRALFNKIRKKKMLGFPMKTYTQKEASAFEKEAFGITKDTYFLGNWQSEQYFKKYRKELLAILAPKAPRTESVLRMIEVLQCVNSVALHVRRGDYIQTNDNLAMAFYDEAIEKMLQLQAQPVFYVFSDDIAFCKEYFAKYDGQVQICYPEYASPNKVVDDLWLMSKCKQMIMANSSYSWWAAWLNQDDEKVVICPELGMWSGDFYPEEWIKIKANKHEAVHRAEQCE